MSTARAARPGPFLLAGALALWACTQSGTGAGNGGSTAGTAGTASGGNPGSGGSQAAGGSGRGGSTASGGSSATGGTTGSGGTRSSGGGSGAGGTASSGGSRASGGSTSSGGSQAAGGSGGAGGATSSGGTRSSGGTPGSGGAPATGGSTSTPDAGSTGACTPPAAGSKGKNPLFTDVYTADPAPLVHDCTFYIACGHDEGSGTGFVLNNWFILKSTDMVNWTRINNALAISNFKWANANAWAAQIVAKDDKFYWYVPVNKIGSCPNNCGMAIGVATASSPEGPYTDALGKPLIDDVFEMSNMGFTLDSDTPYTIDPTVYVDDDGQAYMHYGSFGRVVHVTLGADMTSVTGKMKEVDLGRISASDGKTSFFEAPFLTKRNGKWYEIYAAGANPAAINYSMADRPEGPWTPKGRILDPLPTSSTDGATNHAGVAEFAGQWYIVYHVSNGPSGGGTYHRMVAVDKLTFNADGTIQKVTPSSGLTF
jgi:hypothetical protein